ncbi:unnamed protein product [Dovyalis caffra]|uniref:Bifunctional inhibitor/plant lipid transfer protein/seed storage helical domain-containing protein n=1 Tax=Dovyalis caffra TaxID=77055 RepID=A0AAV1QYD6_9ROSI|nr:unnamed protein product [Dovyalis caffra]
MTTSIHITALDGIVNVNSLFTLAVFVGLAWNPTDPTDTLIGSTDPTSCSPNPKIAEDMIAFHVYSLSSFLFSSLIALALKQAIRIAKTSNHNHGHYLQAAELLLAQVNKNLVRVGMLVSGIGSVCGCVFLMLALVNVVQLKLGSLGCGSGHSYAAIVPLVILVPVALLCYVSVVLYAFTRYRIKERWDHASTYIVVDFLLELKVALDYETDAGFLMWSVTIIAGQKLTTGVLCVLLFLFLNQNEYPRHVLVKRSVGAMDHIFLQLMCSGKLLLVMWRLTLPLASEHLENSRAFHTAVKIRGLKKHCATSTMIYGIHAALIVHCIEEMATPMKYICFVMFLALLSIPGFNQVDGAGECGKNTTPDREAFKLAPCASAAQDETASVSSQCCAQVKKIGQNPACLCAVMLSNTAKSSGIKAEIAITIPKRCNIADRPVGYKCGAYTLP